MIKPCKDCPRQETCNDPHHCIDYLKALKQDKEKRYEEVHRRK